MVKLSVSL